MKFLKPFFIVLVLCVYPMLLEAQICPTRSYNSTWDWRIPNYTFYTYNQGGNERIIRHNSPWFDAHFENLNIYPFSKAAEKDFEPEDGWVLVKRNFGEAGNHVNHPYFVLYNKYSGILRIFVAITTVMGPHDAAEIGLTYQEGAERTAILGNHTLGNRKSLDDFDNKVQKIIVPNNYNFDLPIWLHADFTMNYDPCTCNAKQDLVFDVSLITTSKLEFKVNGQAVQQIDGSGIRGSNSRQSLTQNAQGAIDAGNSFHKSAEKAIDALKKIFPNKRDEFWTDGLIGALPGVGAAAGVADFLVGVFTQKPVEVTPMVFDINMNASGELITSSPHKKIILSNAGSDNLIPATTLEYNNVMGVFNLIETPVINTVKGNCRLEPAYGIDECDYEYKLKSKIKYVINPEIDVDYSTLDIKGAFGDMDFVPLSEINQFSGDYTIGNGYEEFGDDYRDLNSLKLLVTFKTLTGKEIVYVSR